MKILFLDDNLERHKTFMSNNRVGNTLLQAFTAHQALSFMLLHEDIDAIYLDHDLDCSTNNICCNDEEDGRYVCRQMVEYNLHKDAYIMIHSLNFDGGKEMKSILEDAGYTNVEHNPFGWTNQPARWKDWD
jgi:hypothetical protein